MAEIEAMVSVGVLAEGWDNPHCNLIVHLRPTLSKVVWDKQWEEAFDLQKVKTDV